MPEGTVALSRLHAIREAVREANQLKVQSLPSVPVIVLSRGRLARVIWSLRWLLVIQKCASMNTGTLAKESAASAKGKRSLATLHRRRLAHCTVTPGVVLFEEQQTPLFESCS